MQKHAGILSVLALVLTLASVHSTVGQPDPLGPPGVSVATLKTADSLFAARQYTQAFEQYSALRENGHWSPAMFLRMAYIQEGLGHLGESLYYLNLYAITSHDEQASAKMTELAEKNQLSGYEEDPFEIFRVPLKEYYLHIAGLLSALSLVLLAMMANRFREHKPFSVSLAMPLMLLLIGLYVHVQYSPRSSQAIVTHANTYLMSAPSAGAAVVDIIGEGHRVRIKGRSDVWLQVEWKEKEAYIRDFLVKPIRL